ncbi:MAG: ATP-binding protein, partial [Ignavibacteria bacterium]|nr:ATP-binding protein [Ignavibacteria bacterium]
ILYGGRRLLETLNVILQFSKIEAEKVALTPQLFDVVASLRNITERYKIFAQQKNLNLFFENEAVDCYAESDRLLFEEIISQLLNNALKFTEEGTVLVVLKKEEVDLAKYFSVEISDTGIGISPENCQIIFDEFRQVSEGISRYYEGLGLGLTIVKKYTSLLNGKVELQSEVGVGSIFKLRFPMIESERAELVPFTEEEKKPFSLTEFFKETKFENDLPVVLLVEDDPSTSDVITIFLRKVCRLEYANRADKAIQKASEKKYNVILMDINLGKGPSGKEAMELIKQNSTNSDTPVIAVTAYALENEKQTLLSAGFTDYISKPFDKMEIIEKLTSCLLKKN